MAAQLRHEISTKKRWTFRLLAAVGAPFFLLLLLEVTLRITGFGYDTSFLLHSVVNGQKVFIQNSRFAWRFLGAPLSRKPFAFNVPCEKSAHAVRVFVFGESAAYGDPQPEFGLPRMLQAILSLRYPGVRFEVINAAITGINSHAVRAIAKDCTKGKGDVWVIYMGNNEVVGPFGAGTVFGPQSPALPLIRGNLALKATRTGQLMDSLVQSFRPVPADKTEWGGMQMFLENQVQADDPRMTAVYHHFEENLKDILEDGRAAGAGIVVSTVAVNLRDCAPFASQLPGALSEESKARWHSLYVRGHEMRAAGREAEAVALFHEAEAICDRVAELQFTLAEASRTRGDLTDAQRRFALARDLDTLRFRCDSRINTILRRIATGHQEQRIALADAEAEFARQSPDGVPGSEYFYEHVHLTFEGNYLLARLIAEQIQPLLPEPVQNQTDATSNWPSQAKCAQWLAWTDWDRLAALNEMLGRLSDSPFTGQLNHSSQFHRLALEAEKFRPLAQTAMTNAPYICRDALAMAGDDPVLHAHCAKLLSQAGDAPGALRSARRVTELLPNSTEAWMNFGAALARQQQYAEAAQAFQAAVQWDPQDVWALQDLAQTYVKLGRRDEAMRTYRLEISIKPRFGLAYLSLGQLLEEAGDKAEAEKNFRLALTNRIHRAEELLVLARFCQGRGWFRDAATNYLDAIKLRPGDPRLHVSAAQCLAAAGQNAEAEKQYAEAVRLSPASGPMRSLFAVQLSRQGKAAEATEQFEEAVRLMPDVIEVRLNLGIALMKQRRDAEAMKEFEAVLARSPTNATALEYVRNLNARAPAAQPN